MINYDAIDSYQNWLFNNLELIYNTETLVMLIVAYIVSFVRV